MAKLITPSKGLITRRNALIGGASLITSPAIIGKANATLIMDDMLFGSAAPPVCVDDPYWRYVSFLTGFEETNGSTTAHDESSLAAGTGTLSGCSTTTAVFEYGTSSLNVTSNTAGAAWAPNTNWDFTSNFFTIDFSIRPTSIAQTGTIVAHWANGSFGWRVRQVNATLVWQVSTSGANTFNDVTSSAALTAGVWNQCAVTYNGGNVRLWVGGVMVGSTVVSRSIFNSTGNLTIAASGDVSAQEPFLGHVDEVRITNWIARYSANYTPATTLFPRCGTPTCATADASWSSVVLMMGFEGVDGATGAPGMTDESSAAHGTATVVPGSAAAISTAWSASGVSSLFITGTPGGISLPNSTDWNLGSSAFTIEGFIFPPTIAGGGSPQYILKGHNWYLLFRGTNLEFTCTDLTNTTTVQDPSAGSPFPHYICIDFDGTKYRLYNDFATIGTVAMVASSTSVITIANASTVLYIGGPGTTLGDGHMEGFIDELRITKGVARYGTDATFPTPCAPFPRHA